jgi:predicted kinase
MKRFAMMVGLPGSGKTTLFKQYPDLFKGYFRLSLDDFRLLIGGRAYQEPFEPVTKMWADVTIRYMLDHGYDVLIDATSVSRAVRQRSLKLANAHEYETIAFVLSTPYNTCLDRDNKRATGKVGEEVIRRMSEDFEEPTKEEGFDWVVKVADGVIDIETLPR